MQQETPTKGVPKRDIASARQRSAQVLYYNINVAIDAAF
jgi:hypothetical protein